MLTPISALRAAQLLLVSLLFACADARAPDAASSAVRYPPCSSAETACSAHDPGGAPDGGSAPADGTTPKPADLVDCDPRSVQCERVVPDCGAEEMPSVEGGCYGPCVDAARCRPFACFGAAQCSPGFACGSDAICRPAALGGS